MMRGVKDASNDNAPVPPHVREAERRQTDLIRAMTPARRLEIAQELYDAAWAIKMAAIRSQHPEWSEERVTAAVRLVFLTGYAGT